MTFKICKLLRIKNGYTNLLLKQKMEKTTGKNTPDPKKTHWRPPTILLQISHPLSFRLPKGGRATLDLPSHDSQKYNTEIIIIYKHTNICIH